MSRLIPFNRRNRNSISPNLMTPFNMLDDFIGDAVDSIPKMSKSLLAESFKVDISETEREYIVEAELPAIKQQEIELYLDDGSLTIAVERSEETEEKDDERHYLHQERRYSSMQRSLYLIDAVEDASLVRAKLEDGLLEITVPKEEKATHPDKGQRINIE